MKTGSCRKNRIQRIILICLLCILSLAVSNQRAYSGSDSAGQSATPFIGEISCGGWNFCPRGWLECNGAFLPISQYSALFSLIGTTYGGDGRTVFALPDIQGRTMIHQGQGPGLSDREMGQTGGADTVTLTTDQLPAHTHSISAATGAGTSASPVNKVPANAPAADTHFTAAAPDAQMASTVNNAGGSQPHNNLQPYLAIKCCIAIEGIFPPRQ